ncbi:hypothetical protein BU16DRAFT_569630 [Lophium mytilinum]|uniref:Uncharacterized protein n=1 Tax=Lophium mytilinum TaxID=390894 RepID=A0A6A6RB91_9PEZI|nr:hypothetical protein BU16DRAFT_569630 [Lophium mytilinum]
MSASLAPECNEVKEYVLSFRVHSFLRTVSKHEYRRYDSCFLKWYSEKFLRGNATTDECEPLFKQYKQCLGKALKSRGIDSMLEEAREDNRENDAQHLRDG